MSSLSIETVMQKFEVLPETAKREVANFIDFLLYKKSSKKKKLDKDQKTFDPRKFRGAGKLNLTPEEIDRQCAKLRDEWERNI